MRKNVFGRQLKRDTNERKALFKNLISLLILNERIKTTQAKAKAIKGEVDKIVTKAKKGEPARRLLEAQLLQKAVDKAIYDIGPRFADRKGGYCRIIKIGRRLSDNAAMAVMELVERGQNSELKSLGKVEKKEKEAKVEEKEENKTAIRSVKKK